MSRGPTTEANRAFWDRRGEADRPTDASLTMMMDHRAFADYVHRREIALLSEVVSRLGRPRVLDVGCGAGRLELSLAGSCESMVGFDVASSLVERARAASAAAGITNVQWSVGAAGEDRLPARDVDLVILSGVLNSLSDDACRTILRQSSDALRAGGRIFLRNNCANRSRVDVAGSDAQAPASYRTADEYLSMLREAGFEIERAGYLFAPFCWPNLAYYHVLPRALRDHDATRRALGAWFQIEEATSPLRLTLFGKAYPALLRLSRKPTSFHFAVGRKAG